MDGRRLRSFLLVAAGMLIGAAPSLAGPLPATTMDRLARVVGAGAPALPAQPPLQVIPPRAAPPRVADPRDPLVPPAPGLEERRLPKPAPIGPEVADPWDSALMIAVPKRIMRRADPADPWIADATIQLPPRAAIDATDPW